MSQVELTKFVQAPVEIVFGVCSDFENSPNAIEAITMVKMLTDGPVGVGTRFRETRIMFGREATEEMEITRFEPNRLYTLSAYTCGSHFDSTLRFEPQAGGTQVTMSIETRPETLFARLMTPVGWLMMGSMKKMLECELGQIKSICEQDVQLKTATG